MTAEARTTHSGRNLLLKTFILHAPYNELGIAHIAELCKIGGINSHGDRVGVYSAEIYEAWACKQGILPETIAARKNILRMAATLHDIGKLAIAGSVLNKQGRLSDAEHKLMKQHTILGSQLFATVRSELHQAAAEITLNHHERWDGSGYPGHILPEIGVSMLSDRSNQKNVPGKQGCEIPLFARIVAISDVFDALLSYRSYKTAWQEADVLTLIEQEAGKHFDSEIVDAFFACLQKIRAFSQTFLTTSSRSKTLLTSVHAYLAHLHNLLLKIFTKHRTPLPFSS